ncbi:MULTISPECIES: Tn3 family transposase [Brucella/Ochrobactrum group]|uniref:Tn3 family transposase n=1 Tax=Brucella/Ochrobactrum group TaxID=2826938 RepID=UPI000464B377|nr:MULTISPECIES: Tn3 family transposase [Brucella/Ochrobactrum group]MCQ9148146.1 Tn3 family transposase [Ochrobactrum sp. BTU2]
MRKHELLTEHERRQLLSIPENRDDLARLYTFEPDDLDLIRDRREDHNKLGFALQLCILRHPGVPLARILGAIPASMVSFVAEQIDVRPEDLASYGARSQTMSDHARELAQMMGVRAAERSDIPMMIDAGAVAATATDKGMPIAVHIVTTLRQAGIVLPTISTIERAGIAGRARARKHASQALIGGLTSHQFDLLDSLVQIDPKNGLSSLAWLKTMPVSAKADSVRDILERLSFVRTIGIPAANSATLHPDRYRQLVREGRMSPSYIIERYTLSRRRATLVAFLIDAEERLTDAAIDMADKLIGSMFTRAKNAKARKYEATAKDVSRLMRLFRGTIDALAEAIETDSDPVDTINASVGWANLLRARHEVAEIADTADQDPLIVAADRYATLRKFAPALIEALEFKASKGSARTISAVKVLREAHRTGKRELPSDAPMPFKKDWQKIVVGPDGKINRKLYEVATLAHLRNKLRSGDVWVERSSSYRRFDSYLLPPQMAGAVTKGLALPASADDWLEQRGRELDWRLKRFSKRLQKSQVEGVNFDGNRLSITPLRSATSPSAETFVSQVEGMIPRIRITELLHEVASQTGFLGAFTNLRTGQTCPNDSAMLAAILADATNLGLSRMARASEGISRDQLIWTKDAYIRDDTYAAALAMIIDAHHRLPIASIWGDGTASSSDGQFFRGGKRAKTGGDVNARYGVDPGFGFYTHVSDQHGPYHVKVISAATHEAPYVLDGLLHHGTNLNISEHYTDTGGATDHVFALCAALGFRFCPRLRDFPDRRLIPIEPTGSYPDLAPLLGKKVRADIIREHWDDVLRLVASLKSGHVAPSTMLRKLAAYERQNQLDVALQEIGKVERTLFMLDWLENPALRQRCQAGLNKSEQRHALTQAICTFRQGRIIDRSHEAQQYRASGLNLVIAAIVYWNSTYMADALAHLRSTGKVVGDAMMAHTSPVGWEHIAFSGDFLWEQAAKSRSRKTLVISDGAQAA